jgi:hypothetical protein
MLARVDGKTCQQGGNCHQGAMVLVLAHRRDDEEKKNS